MVKQERWQEPCVCRKLQMQRPPDEGKAGRRSQASEVPMVRLDSLTAKVDGPTHQASQEESPQGQLHKRQSQPVVLWNGSPTSIKEAVNLIEIEGAPTDHFPERRDTDTPSHRPQR
eukprot:328734-Hanusia_phi.AAC.1